MVVVFMVLCVVCWGQSPSPEGCSGGRGVDSVLTLHDEVKGRAVGDVVKGYDTGVLHSGWRLGDSSGTLALLSDSVYFTDCVVRWKDTVRVDHVVGIRDDGVLVGFGCRYLVLSCSGRAHTLASRVVESVRVVGGPPWVDRVVALDSWSVDGDRSFCSWTVRAPKGVRWNGGKVFKWRY